MSSFTFVDVKNFTPNSMVNWTPVGNIASVSRAGNVFALDLASGGRTLQLSFLSDACFRVRFNPEPGADYAVETSPAVVNRNLGPVHLAIEENTPQALVVDTGAMRVRVDLQPYRIRVFRPDGQLISADEPVFNLVYIPGQRVIANFKTRTNQSVYCGFGEKAGAQLAKNLFTMTQFNYDNFIYVGQVVPQGTQPGPLNPSDPLYASIPIVIEVNPNPTGAFIGRPYCCGLFFDNPAQSYFNMGSNDYSDMTGKYYFGALYGDLDYYFFLGNKVVDVLGQYTTLTGRSPMPPKYVFGFHQGCYGYFDRTVLEGAANAYRNAGIPIDGLHIDVDFQNNYRTFTHSEKKFPNAAQMMQNLHNQGFKCSTNITPLLTDTRLDENGQETPYDQRQALLQMGGLIYDTRAGQGLGSNLFEGNVNYGFNNGFNPHIPVGPLGAPGNYPDLGRANVRATWGQQYAHLINNLGMDMIWQDMTCPALKDTGDTPFKTFPLDLMINNNVTFVPDAVCHNAYVLFLLEGTWNGLNALRPNIRNFIIARGGYAGLQRYAALWTGDSASSWDFLAINISEVLNLGLSGVPISGCDIGGFASGSGMVGNVCGFELLTRWMQLGSFLPWYRNHYDGYNKAFQEPYRYGEPVPTNCRKYVQLRYRMLQIYYDAMYEWTQTGMPIARALFLNDPDDPQVYNHLNDQFFVGRDVLVAPIVTQQWTRQVYLPAGSQWYAFKDNSAKLDAPVPGGMPAFDYFAPLDLVPIYIRAGAILPMRELEQYVGQLPQNPLTINVYPGADSTYRLYQDDGISFDAQNKKIYRLTEISHQEIAGGQNIRVRRVDDKYTPPEKYYFVALPGTQHPSSVTVAGAALRDVQTPDNLAASTSNAYYWNASSEVTFIKVFDTVADVTIIALF